MNERKRSARKAVATPRNDHEFYETMPLSMGSHYVYRDDVHDYDGADNHAEAVDYDATIRRVAVITLVVSALVALVAGFLFAQGLATMRDAMPVNNPTSSLEL